MLKCLFLITFLSSQMAIAQNQWVRSFSVGSGVLDSSSVFDVNSTTKGSRPCPIMTEAQRDAISTPGDSLCVYNSDTDLFNFYNGTIWGALGSGGGAGGSFDNLQLLGKGTANWTAQAAIPGNVLIQDNANSGSFHTLTPNTEWGFVFTPGNTGDLKFYIATWRNIAATTGVIKFVLRATTAGVPSGAILASGQTALTLGNQGILNSDVNFVVSPGGVTLLKGSQYYLAFENDNGDGNIEVQTSTASDNSDVNYEDLVFPYDTWLVAGDQNTLYGKVYFDNVLAIGDLVLDTDMYVNVPGVLKDRHKIAAQTISIEDDEVAWITIDKTQPGAPTTRAVTVEDVTTFVDDGTKLIFLTSIDQEAYFGLHDPSRIEDGETINIQKNNSTVSFSGLNLHTTPGAPQTVTAAGGVTIGSFDRQAIFIESNGGTVNVTANPQIIAGPTSGQEIVLIGTSDTNYIILEDGDGLALNGQIDLKNQSSISLFWTGVLWQEKSRR